VARWLFSPFIRIAVEGSTLVPRRGSVLVLANHVGFWDPLVLSLGLGRPIQFLATETAFRKKLLSFVAHFFGAIPKMKFHPDVRAIFKLQDWSELGSAVGLFPEGVRSWDGRRTELAPGIGKLIRLLGVPVVTARIFNAERLSPRWALHQRRGHVLVHFEAPVRFSPSVTAAEIEEHVGRAISVDVENSPRGPVYGKQLAAGITNLLFMCPACFSLESLDTSRNTMRCLVCGDTWRIGSDNRLASLKTGHRMLLHKAIDRLKDYLDRHGWGAELGRFWREGVILESQEVRLQEIGRRRVVDIGEGRLQLTRTALRLIGTAEWSVRLSDILVSTVDLARDLRFRSRDKLFGVLMPRESVVKWSWFVEHWRAKALSR